jgi:hypothetical protein
MQIFLRDILDFMKPIEQLEKNIFGHKWEMILSNIYNHVMLVRDEN